MGIRSRLATTALLVLVALGGAGLAVAADRFQTSAGRPELTWADDRAAAPYIAAIDSDLQSLAGPANGLAKAGRDTLANLQSQDLVAVDGALGAGAAAADEIGAALSNLDAHHTDADAHITRWRLGADTADQLAAADAAVSAVDALPAAWTEIATRAKAVSALIGDLQDHDAAVFRATTDGRNSDWTSSFTDLGNAHDAVSAAHVDSGQVGAGARVDTLDQLLDRYDAYDAALTVLYGYLAAGGVQSGTTFESLNGKVLAAQSVLPTNSGVFSIIVSEATGSSIADALATIGQGRGAIDAALQPSATPNESAAR
jgi:hypothetical protein